MHFFIFETSLFCGLIKFYKNLHVFFEKSWFSLMLHLKLVLYFDNLFRYTMIHYNYAYILLNNYVSNILEKFIISVRITDLPSTI